MFNGSVVASCAVFAALALPACDLDNAVLFNCSAHCEDVKGSILLDGVDKDGNRFEVDDEATLCQAQSIRDAFSCAECRAAFAEEFRLVSVKHICTCSEEGDTIDLIREDCSFDQVVATPESCAEAQSSENKEKVFECFAT
jgi:hypothetical protein